MLKSSMCGQAKNIVVYQSGPKEIWSIHLYIWELEEVAVVPEEGARVSCKLPGAGDKRRGERPGVRTEGKGDSTEK